MISLRIAAAGVCLAAGCGAAVLLSPAEAEQLRAAIARGDAAMAAPAGRLRAEAAKLLKEGPWSVTDARPRISGIDPHDYYSEGTYWWPDPKNPAGPYIRKDGHTYPGRFMQNKAAMNAMAEAVFTLGAAAYLFDDAAMRERAARVAAAGIIDSRVLIRAARGFDLLERTGKLDPALRDGVRRWFADYATWLTTSRKGLDEKQSGNNHASWWTAQVAAFAGLSGDRAPQADPTRRQRAAGTGADPVAGLLGVQLRGLHRGLPHRAGCRRRPLGCAHRAGGHARHGGALPASRAAESLAVERGADRGVRPHRHVLPRVPRERSGGAWPAFVDLMLAR